MRVKRYLVESMPDALQKIRSDLGNDAIILSTKDIKHGGFLGLFGKKKIEVVAAIDPASAASKPPVQPIPRPATQLPLDIIKPLMSATVKQEEIKYEVPPKQMENIRAAESTSKYKEDAILAEMKSMREMIQKLSVSAIHQQAGPVLPDVLQKYEARLIEQEVGSEIIHQLIETCMEEIGSEGEYTEAAVRGSLRNQLLRFFPSEPYRSLNDQTRIVHFVGPTGVGKTTTIAKMAAEQVLKHRRRVGFITSDTYRIAAIEQLKTYANILNVPTEVVFSPKDLNRAFEQLNQADIIFMDTAGRNYRNEMYVSELHTLLQSEGQSETYLVLSMTTKYRDMKAITENFQKFNLDKVILTKFDETDSYGCILNLVNDFGLNFSYISNGQNVPDDIELFREDRIIDLILGDSSYE
jgi:flagellar biosynthesis protein FlhF